MFGGTGSIVTMEKPKRQNIQGCPRETPAGLYIHIPFCLSKCAYCDFDSAPFPEDVRARYVESLCVEISKAKRVEADTVYFGGGTPSLLAPLELGKILGALRERFTGDAGEITLEANPETITPAAADAWAGAGINRVSVGAQSFHDDELSFMGRRHNAKDTLKALALLRKAGIRNIGIDLIVGLPHQTLQRWEETLSVLFALKPEHFSAYILDIHEGAAWSKEQVSALLPKERVTVKMYERLMELASVQGYVHYEISNFCLPGYASRHNLKYFSDEPYLGFGPSAHSYTIEERFWNVTGLLAYLGAMGAKGNARAGSIQMSLEDRRKEAFMMGMRKTEGVDLESFFFLYGWDILKEHAGVLERFMSAGVLELSKRRLRFTPKGYLVSNEVLASFF
jgi:oxygen-independent coproporphyrinogen-3 oxidase